MAQTGLHMLLVVNVYRPDLGGGVLFSDLCEGLVERGIDVTVRCAVPYYPEWKDKNNKNGVGIERYAEQGVQVERYGLFIPPNPNSLLQRLVYEASFFASLARRVPRKKSFDLIMVFCPLIGAVAYGALAKKRCRCPLWLNVQDLSADAAAAGGISKSATVSRLLNTIQQQLFNRADIWSTISPVMKSRLEQLRKLQQPVLYFPNWLHASLARAIDRQPSKTGRLPATPVRLLYSGNIGTKQDLLRFCTILRNSDLPFYFLIQGDGSRSQDVRRWVQAQNDHRFTFKGLSDEEGLAAALFETDFFVITEKSGSGGSFIPSKLIPSLASGTPVLAVSDAESPLAQEMSTSQSGPHFQWSNAQDITGLLRSVQKNPDAFLTWQQNARERSTLYNRQNVIDRYAAAIEDVIIQRLPLRADWINR